MSTERFIISHMYDIQTLTLSRQAKNILSTLCTRCQSA